MNRCANVRSGDRTEQDLTRHPARGVGGKGNRPLHEPSIRFLATGAGVGNIGQAPGTLGSLVGLPLCYLFSLTAAPLSAILVVFFIAGAVWVSGRAERLLQEKDPGCIVVDEIAGMLVTFFGMPLNWLSLAAGFLLFRLFDILKPFPIRVLDRRLKGGVGIVADDLVAGLFAHLVLWLMMTFFHAA